LLELYGFLFIIDYDYTVALLVCSVDVNKQHKINRRKQTTV